MISEQAQSEIQHIMNELTMGENPNKMEEIERIRKVCNKGIMNKLKTVKVDLYTATPLGASHDSGEAFRLAESLLIASTESNEIF